MRATVLFKRPFHSVNLYSRVVLMRWRGILLLLLAFVIGGIIIAIVLRKPAACVIIKRSDLEMRFREGDVRRIATALIHSDKSYFKGTIEGKHDLVSEGNDSCVYVRFETDKSGRKAYTFFSGYYSKSGAELLWDANARQFWVRGWHCKFDGEGKSIGNIECAQLEPLSVKYNETEICAYLPEESLKARASSALNRFRAIFIGE